MGPPLLHHQWILPPPTTSPMDPPIPYFITNGSSHLLLHIQWVLPSPTISPMGPPLLHHRWVLPPLLHHQWVIPSPTTSPMGPPFPYYITNGSSPTTPPMCPILLYRLRPTEHTYRANTPGIENDRTMHFYSKARIDGLIRHEETSDSMTQYFVDRDDKLHYRSELVRETELELERTRNLA